MNNEVKILPHQPPATSENRLSSPPKIGGAGGGMKASHVAAKHLKNKAEMLSYRKELRNNSTMAEKALWNWLKNKNVDGLKFRRQFSVGNYILDFYCPKLKLAIELDGEYHFHLVQPTEDYIRDKWLKDNYGITVLRFENEVVFKHPYVIINGIRNFASQQLACFHPQGARGGMKTSLAVAHTPQSLRASSPILGEQLSASSKLNN